MQLKSVLISATIFIVTLVVGLCAVEFALRMKNSSMKNYNIEMWRYANTLKKLSEDPLLGHEHVPSSKAVLQSVEIRINADGLRGAEVKAIPAQRRILFLGSSITLGWGIEEEKVMTSLLQKDFDDRGMDVEVLNAGIGNYNTARYVRRFMTRLSHLEPTDIVVNYFVNDAEELPVGGGNMLLRNSQLAATVWGLVQSGLGGGIEDLVAHYQGVYDENSKGYRDMVSSLTQLAAYAQKNNIRIYFLMTPDIHQLQDYPFNFIHDKVTSLARALGFRVVDTLDVLSKYSAEELWAMPGDPHPNALGHRIMADSIRPVLELQN